MTHRTKHTALALALLLGIGSCDYATDVQLLEIQGTGVLFGQAYLDLNGTGAADGTRVVLERNCARACADVPCSGGWSSAARHTANMTPLLLFIPLTTCQGALRL